MLRPFSLALFSQVPRRGLLQTSTGDCPKRGLTNAKMVDWTIYEAQEGPKSAVSEARKVPLQAHTRLFGQFLEVVFSEVGTSLEQEGAEKRA